MKIGVIGLGNMGAAMARNLVKHGHEVVVYNRTASKAKPLVDAGATQVSTPADASLGDAVLTMLSNDAALEEAVFDTKSGVLNKQGKNTIHLSMSTVSPSLVKKITEISHERGVPFISAPVLGRPDVAERGELVVMTAGDAQLITDCRPLFDAISSKVHVLGEHPEQANAAKVAANYLISVMIQSLGEAFALTEKAGVDRTKFYELVAFDFFKSPIYQKYGKIIVDRNFRGGAFSVRMQSKDTRLAADCARELECPMPFLSALQDTFLSALARGKGDLDPCALTEVIAENAGLIS